MYASSEQRLSNGHKHQRATWEAQGADCGPAQRCRFRRAGRGSRFCFQPVPRRRCFQSRSRTSGCAVFVHSLVTPVSGALGRSLAQTGAQCHSCAMPFPILGCLIFFNCERNTCLFSCFCFFVFSNTDICKVKFPSLPLTTSSRQVTTY